jgi:hypothetical protein
MSPAAKKAAPSAKKSAAKKSGAKNAAAKTAPRPSRAASDSGSEGSAVTGARLAYLAAEQLVELTRKPFEGVVGLERTEDGWRVLVEVLEMRRIPETTDILGAYEVSVDASGELVSYRRVHRYLRGEAGEDR